MASPGEDSASPKQGSHGNFPSEAALDIAPVWSGHLVAFSLLTHGDQQFVAFYDEHRQMTLAQRIIGGKMVISIAHKKYGSGIWEIDPVTLKLKGKLPADPGGQVTVPPQLGKPESTFPGMQVRWAGDLAPESGDRSYRLRWETLPVNRDMPRERPWPEPSMLRLVTLQKNR